MVIHKLEMRTTTVRLPRPVYEQAKCVLERERVETKSVSMNDLFVAAITAYLRLHNRRQIDAAFAGMSEDAEYQKEARLIAEEFEYSDWEALGLEASAAEEEPAYAAASSR